MEKNLVKYLFAVIVEPVAYLIKCVDRYKNIFEYVRFDIRQNNT